MKYAYWVFSMLSCCRIIGLAKKFVLVPLLCLMEKLEPLFGQPNICKHLETGGRPQKGDACMILGEDETAAGFS